MIKTNLLALIVFLFYMTTGCSQTQSSKAKSSKPNIIFILADDLGYETLSCNGSISYKTPHLDRMAAKGVRFTNAYATPLCTPSRVTIMTGKYNFRNYVNFGAINPNDFTFGSMMKNAGYKTFVAGKWQLGESSDLPAKLGFDQYALWHLSHQEQLNDRSSRYKDPVIVDNSGKVASEGKYGPDIFANRVMRFMEQNQKSPFFIYYPMVLTHSPFQPTPDQPDFATHNVKKTKDPVNFKYMVSYMDKIVGQIMDKAEKLGIAENTIIIFTGDNGTGKDITSMMKGNVVVKGGKGSTTVPGTLVPLIAYWKGKTKGAVYDDLIDFTDFMPTLAEAISMPLPKKEIFDGTSFYGRLAGKPSKQREWLYCYYTKTKTGEVDKAEKYAQDKVWKLYDTGKFYDIVNDPTHQKPLDVNSLSVDVKQRHAKLQAVLNNMISQEKKKS